MAHLAFSICRPGQDFEESKFEQWVTTVNGGVAPAVGALAAIRRLHFEAEIVVTSTLKASVEQAQESTTPRPLPSRKDCTHETAETAAHRFEFGRCKRAITGIGR